MLIADPFAGPYPAQVDAVAHRISGAFKDGMVPVARQLIADESLPPAALSAGIAKAYANGLISAIVAGTSGDRDTVVAEICAWVRAGVARDTQA